MNTPLPSLDHDKFMRRSFAVARRARTHGNHPFGALLVSATGEVLMEVENGYMPDRDMTGHAERLLATQASKQFDPKFLAGCTLYTSAEPCCMCAGAALLGRHRPRRVWAVRASAEDHHRQSRREPDAGFAVPDGVRRRAAPCRSYRPAAGG